MRYNAKPIKKLDFVYNFQRDGGAIGTVNLAVFIPANSVVMFGWGLISSTFTGGAGASISVGFGGDATAIMGTINIASILPGVRPVQFLPNFDIFIAVPVEITFTISANSLTEGILWGNIQIETYVL